MSGARTAATVPYRMPLADGLASASRVVLFIIMPMLMVVANKSAPASLGLAALLANGAALAGAPSSTLMRRYRRTLTTGTAACLASLAAVAIASLGWTIDPEMSRRGLLEAAPELLFGLALAAAWPSLDRSRHLRLLNIGLVGAATLIAVEAWCGMPLHHIVGARAESYDMKRSVVPLVLLLWPALEHTRGHRLWSTVLVGAVLMAAVFAHAAAAALAVVVAVIVYGVALVAPRTALYAVAALAFGLLVLTPWTGTIAGHALSSRAIAALRDQHADHRVRIWTAFERRIRDKHLIGHGFDTSFRVADLVEREGGGTPAGDQVIDNIHPHDVLLQIWVEFGLVGAIGLGMAIVFVTMRLKRLPDRARAFRLAFIAANAVVALVGLNAWAPWWLAAVAVCLTLFAALRDRRDSSESAVAR